MSTTPTNRYTLHPDTLRKICPNLTAERAILIAGLINEIAPKYNADTKDALEEFIATVAHESGEFAIKTENMNYTRPERIAAIWPSRFKPKGKLDPRQYVRNPQKLANEVYANRMGNGDAASNEPFLYRGGGFIQVTGKDSYQKYAKYKGIDIATAAASIRNFDRDAMDSAFWLFFIEKRLLDEALNDDFEKVTYRINGGKIGWEDRVKYLDRCKRFL